MTKRQILSNQILTDIGFWLEDYGAKSDYETEDKNQPDVDWHSSANEALGIMAKIKNLLTMGDEDE